MYSQNGYWHTNIISFHCPAIYYRFAQFLNPLLYTVPKPSMVLKIKYITMMFYGSQPLHLEAWFMQNLTVSHPTRQNENIAHTDLCSKIGNRGHTAASLRKLGYSITIPHCVILIIHAWSDSGPKLSCKFLTQSSSKSEIFDFARLYKLQFQNISQTGMRYTVHMGTYFYECTPLF